MLTSLAVPVPTTGMDVRPSQTRDGARQTANSAAEVRSYHVI